MQTLRISYPLSIEGNELPATVAAIGFFDGIHKGHQKVIGSAVQKAKESGLLSAVISFYPHPSAILDANKKEVRYITPTDEKEKILAEMDVDRFYIIDFTKELAEMSSEDFLHHFIEGLNIKHLIAGFDFTYGKKGAGNMEQLAAQRDLPFTVETIPEQQSGGEKISSTRIRKLLAEGKIEETNELLGRPLIATGIVIHGSKRGRELGWRTANIQVADDTLLPRIGVYAVRVHYNGEIYNGMASLGYNPTFQYDVPDVRMEVHIFDFQKDIYGEQLSVEWHDYIRDEVKFTGIDDLIARIAKDEVKIRSYFEVLE